MRRVYEVDDLRRLARRRLPRMVADFVDGGADGEVTLAANRAAFDAITFRPRTFVDVSRREFSVSVFGEEIALPVLLAPAGLARLVHPAGELAAARAAHASGTVFTPSITSSYSLEDIAAVSEPRWIQLYLWRDRSVVAALIERARAAGYRVLCVTVDVPIVGKRVRDMRNGLTIPLRIRPGSALDVARHPRWAFGMLRGGRITFSNLVGVTEGDSATALAAYVNRDLIDASVSWREAAWLRDLWDGPLVIKGILTGEDAVAAVDVGADGVVVSNHGGRQLDGAPPTVTALPEVVEAVAGRAEVFLDGGVRRGADVVKAVALGATAVLVGRPWFWGLAAGGEAGVARMIEILADEIDRTLTLIGRPRIADVDGTAVSSA